MVRQNTIGFVIFKMVGREIKYLMLHHEGQYWNFPKGRQESGESELATAKRELAEETGIQTVEVIKDFRYEYDYDIDTIVSDGVKEKAAKHAIFFLGQVQDQEIKISAEHLDYGWFDFETALKRAFYQDGQNLIKAANQFLSKR
ncbi:MAG: NUDIX domain-containing protein [Candidatus Buchananbacteria bacterium]|nr:NUDIX domain-containing protein [Candidatus Buchananbacteria bacterium]